MNKDELIEKVKQLTDFTNDEKAELIAGLRKKKYGLVWENHPEAVEERLRTQLPVLVEETSKALTDGGEDAPNHILIEGDNLEALTALTYTHEGKVDVIYIDPPYNTGNKDFVYNDTFVDSEDGYRHSKWLSFMEKRLRIAKKLLSDKGVIFISIDDNEQANLKLLCDEVFGGKNFLCDIIWNSTKSVTNTAIVSVAHTHNLVYFNKISYIVENRTKFRIPEPGIGFENPDDDPRGPWKADPFQVGGWRPNQQYEIINPNTGIIYKPNKGCSWKNDYENYVRLLEDNRIVFGKNGTAGPQRKRFLSEATERGRVVKTIWDDIETTTNGTQLLKEIFCGECPFTNPKPITLICRFLQLGSYDNSLILDFFAGSGTTLHATMQLNKEDGGHRQCILVTNNENGICENVTYERNKRVINGYTTPKGEKVEGLHGNNLRYYKVDFVERDNSLEGMRKLMETSTDLLCIKHDIYHEEHTFGNLKLRPHIARYFADKTGRKMLIIYKVDAIEYFVKEIAQMPEGTQIMVYVFSTNNYAMDADFEEVADKVTLCALPAAIYNAYLKVLPKKKIPIGEDVDQEEPTLFNGEEDEQ